MFGGNPFAALSEAGASSVEPEEGPEVDIDWLRLVKPNHDVHVKLTDRINLEGLPEECNLLAIANSKGLLFAGGNVDVKVYSLKDVHTALYSAGGLEPLHKISLPQRPIWIRLAMNEEILVIATSSQIYLHRLENAGLTSTPYHIFPSSQLLDVLPNPASTDLSRYVTLLSSQGFIIADIANRQLLPPINGIFTCCSWSARGKQLVLGTPSGLVQYTPEGVEKARIPSPDSTRYPTHVQWLENDLFLVAYADQNAQRDDSLDIYIIKRQGESFSYIKFYDINDTMGHAGRSSLFRRFAGLRNWGKSKHLDFFISGRSSAIGVLHSSDKWEALILEETARGVLPAAKGVDATCLGFELDLTSREVIKRGIVAGIELPDLPPAPRILVYSQEGEIVVFDVQNSEAEGYPGMVSAIVDHAPTSMPTPAGPTAPVNASVSTPAQSPFGKPDQAAFGQKAPNVSTPFGTAFGVSQTPSAFGQTPTNTSVFGKPAPASGATKTAFGQSSGGPTASSAFGASVSSPPAFGLPSSAGPATPSAFGKPAFGAASEAPSAFGQSSPSGSTAPAAFGKTAFGASPSGAIPTINKPSPGGFSPASAFGKPAFGASAFGAPAFGAPAFGALAAPKTAVGTAATASSGFGAFASTTTKPAVGFGFGAAASSTSSGFGAFGKSEKPIAFSGFGTSTGDTSKAAPAFSGFGQSSKPTATVAAASDDFGLGSFADALSTSKSVPGLEDSPPGSPVLPGRTRLAGLEDSPPNSPPSRSTPVPPSTSTFIQPPKAFAAPTGFGAFGQAAAKAIAPVSSTPAAFSSTPVQPPKPATGFGQVAFGQSTVAFGQSTIPGFGSASGTTTFQPKAPIGNISGGFGGFAKPADSEKPSAFAGLSSGPSIFGAPSTSASFGSTKPFTSAFPTVLGSGKETSDALPKIEPPETIRKAAPAPLDIRPASPSSDVPAPSSSDIEAFTNLVRDEPAEESSQSLASPGVKTEDDQSEEGEVESNVDKKAEMVAESATQAAEIHDEASGSEEEEDYETEDEYPDSEGQDADDSDEDNDVEDEGDQPIRSRRSFSSVPDLPTVTEGEEKSSLSGESSEEEEQELEEEPSPSTKPPKSPPWFAKTASTPILPAEQSSEPSPLSRPSPSLPTASGKGPQDSPPIIAPIPTESAPVMEPSKPLLKHAARTSSPLSTQPVFTAASTTPPGSPAKISSPKETSSSGLFDQPPATLPSAGPAATSTTFTDRPKWSFGLNKGSTSGATSPEPSFFSTPPRTTAAALQPSTGFSFDKAKNQDSHISEPPSKTNDTTGSAKVSPFGLGLGRPSQVGAQNPIQSFTPPSRSSAIIVPPVKVAGNTMSAVLERTIKEVERDLTNVRNLLDHQAKFHSAHQTQLDVDITTDQTLPLSTISSISKTTSALLEDVTKLRSVESTVELKLGELQSNMLKTDLKLGQAEKYLKARKDPSFARAMQIRELSPQQAASQVRLRKLVQTTESRLDELDTTIASLKRRGERAHKSQPALERVQKSVRNVDSAIRDRQQTIDELSKRISSIRLSTPTKSTPQAVVSQPRQSSKERLTLEPSSETLNQVEAAMIAREKVRLSSSKVRITKSIKTNRTIMIDALPVPSRLKALDDATGSSMSTISDPRPPPKSSQSQSQSSNPSSSPFDGLNFSLDPGNITSSHSRTRQAVGTRGHTPAAKLHHPPVPGTATTTKPTAGGGFSFDPPPKLESDDYSPPRKPMFSFAGFGK